MYSPLQCREHHTKKIWKELSKGFDEYHIIARSKNNKFNYSVEGNIHLHLIPKIITKSRIFIISSFLMYFVIKKHKINYLLCQSALFGGFSAAIFSKVFKIPLMVEIHGEEYFRILKKGGVLSKIIRYSFKTAVKIRSLSSSMTQKLGDCGYQDKVVLIPNRVNLNLFSQTKQNFEIKNCLKLVSVGRFVWEKNYLNLIKTLHQSNLNFCLTLIGGGPLKNEYLDYITKNKLNKTIKLIDWVDQHKLIELIISSDIYIQSSVSEGMPRTILEAMALKIPIISTAVGSIKGVLLNNKNSLLIDSSLIELVNKISALKNDINLRKNLTNVSYTDVKSNYEWSLVFESYRKELLSMSLK